MKKNVSMSFFNACIEEENRFDFLKKSVIIYSNLIKANRFEKTGRKVNDLTPETKDTVAELPSGLIFSLSRRRNSSLFSSSV